MSGFLSSEAERALMGVEEDARRLFEQGPGMPTPSIDDNACWAHAHTSSSGHDYFHPEPVHAYASSSSASRAGSSSSSNTLIPTQDSGPSDVHNYGYLNADNRSWRCAYPGCASKATFVRPCDLRKHFHRHSKNYFCRYEGCPQGKEGGFSSKKDRIRHEAKHNPGIECEHEGCERKFSRVDNMKDHVRRIHKKPN